MIFGLAAALGWGLADFGGAVAGRRIGSVATVIVGQLLSVAFMTVVLVVSGEAVAPAGAIVGWIALNGIFTATAYLTHYRALELGPVAVVSPIGATYAVVGVALAIVVLGERPDPTELLGAAVTVLGVMLVSTDLRKLRAGTHGVPPGLPWAIASAAGFGVAAFLLGYASKEVGWVTGLWASRMAQVACYVPSPSSTADSSPPCGPTWGCGSRSGPGRPTSSASRPTRRARKRATSPSCWPRARSSR